jgi:ATP-dependent RNA helicase DeaD
MADNLFEELPDELQAGIRELGWTKPMPVQERVLPAMATGDDLIVQAQTGSGKTGAFGIPLVGMLDPDVNACQALIMLPTRELAGQVAKELEILGKAKGIRCLPVYGGVGYQQQIDAIEEGAHVIVGTPGRVLDHINNGRLTFESLRALVLDEADEMLSLGFWPDMREINKHLPKGRQSCLFSATIPEKVRSLSRFFLEDPKYVSLNEDQVAPQQIEHFFMVTTAQEKEKNLARILEYEDPESAIIFCNTKDDVRFVTAFLQRRGFDADQISGDLTQVAREKAMARIKAGKLRFLVATDVAARGIDISDLSHVIGYSSPDSPDVYVHRITERPVPTDKQIAGLIGERLAVKVEQEIRALPERERQNLIERFRPIVETLTETEDGKQDLAAICAFYLAEHQPETTVSEPDLKANEERDRDSGRGRDRKSGGGGGGRKRRRPRRD